MVIIGRLLVDYGELELGLMNCVQVSRGYDLNSTLKAMFCVRSEMSRIKIAGALAQSPYSLLGLDAAFSAMIDAMNHCRMIRNKYAHAYWHDPNQGKNLCYVSVEELADEPGYIKDLANLTFFFIDEPLLLQQERYFEYTRDLTTYLNHEGRLRAKLIISNPFPLPTQMQKPPFFTHKT